MSKVSEPTLPLTERELDDLENAVNNVETHVSDGIDWTYMSDIRKLIDFYRANAPWN